MNVAVWHVTSFYRFLPFSEAELPARRDQILAWLEGHQCLGLVLLAPEGINATIAGSQEAMDTFKAFLADEIGVTDASFKDSQSERRPFRDLRVVIREEIVGLKRPDLAPFDPDQGHLSPKEWHEMLEGDENPVLIDTRNHYETKIGIFPGAIDPNITNFSEWGAYADKADLPKDRPIMIYCTGGIRCEKVMLDLRERGFEKVFQLRDGILGYLEEYPEGHFQGECFVFDDRVAVDANLTPSKIYDVCPGCGGPAESKFNCAWCEGPSFVCEDCRPNWLEACSKTCRDRLQRHGPRKQNPEGVSKV